MSAPLDVHLRSLEVGPRWVNPDAILFDLLLRFASIGLQTGMARGLCDAVIYAFIRHRHHRQVARSFLQQMDGFIRTMTAQMPAYAHISFAYCHFAEPLPSSLLLSLLHASLRPSPPPLRSCTFRLHPPKKGHSQLPSLQTSTQQLGLELPGWAAFADRGQSKTEKRPWVWRGHPLSAQRLPRHVWCSQPEPTLAHMGAKHQSNNAAEVSALIEPLRFFQDENSLSARITCLHFYDSADAADACMEVSHLRSNISLANQGHKLFHSDVGIRMDLRANVVSDEFQNGCFTREKVLGIVA